MNKELLKELLNYLKTDNYDETCTYHIELIEKIEKELNNKKYVYVISYRDDCDFCDYTSGVSYVYENREDAEKMLETIFNDELNYLNEQYDEIETEKENDCIVFNCNAYTRYVKYSIDKMEIR